MRTVLQIVFLSIVLAGVAAAGETQYLVSTPEISAGTAASALGLVAGGLLVMRARLKK